MSEWFLLVFEQPRSAGSPVYCGLQLNYYLLKSISLLVGNSSTFLCKVLTSLATYQCVTPAYEYEINATKRDCYVRIPTIFWTADLTQPAGLDEIQYCRQTIVYTIAHRTDLCPSVLFWRRNSVQGRHSGGTANTHYNAVQISESNGRICRAFL